MTQKKTYKHTEHGESLKIKKCNFKNSDFKVSQFSQLESRPADWPS